MNAEVRAAGGLLVHQGEGGARVAVVHRPHYDDWSLPKGKLEDGEEFAAAALREVEEETGLACELLRELPATRYADHHGRDKVVRYWLMRPRGGIPGEFEPNEEVDELRWLAPAEALALLDYEHDRRLIGELDGAGA